MIFKKQPEKGTQKGSILGRPWGPKIDHKSTQGAPKEAPGGVPEVPREGGRKKSGFWTPLTAENEAGAWTPARFPLFTRSLRRTPKWSQNGCPLASKSVPRRPKDVSRDASKKSQIRKRSQNGSQLEPKGHQKTSKRATRGDAIQSVFSYTSKKHQNRFQDLLQGPQKVSILTVG